MILPIFKPADIIIKLLANTKMNFEVNALFIINSTSNSLTINTKNALYKFLVEYRDSTETLKLYLKELERLILWCNLKKLDLLAIKREDIVYYQQFLQDPTPTELWCGNKVPKILKTEDINPEWRPYYKKLSSTSIKKILKIIDSFFNYMVQLDLLSGNPLAINRRRNRNKSLNKLVERYLELDEINACLTTLSKYAIDSNQSFVAIRAKYIILLLFYTGIRISEAAQHTMGDFVKRENNWFLGVVGKGKKYREIPIPDELLDVLSDFRTTIGLTKIPMFKETTPLIPNLNLKDHLTARRIDQILKWAFQLAAKNLHQIDPHKGSKLQLASAHWLRHSYVTYLLNNGAPLKVAQENAGHSDISTTMLYRHVNQIDRHKATRNLSLKAKIDLNDD